jgi:hypothetical protein
MTVVKYKIKYRNLRGGDDEPEEKKVEEQQQEQGEQQQEDEGTSPAGNVVQEEEGTSPAGNVVQEEEGTPPAGNVVQEEGDVAPSVGDVAPGEGDEEKEGEVAAPAPAGADEVVSEPTVVVEVTEPPKSAGIVSTILSTLGISGPSPSEETPPQGPIVTGVEIPTITMDEMESMEDNPTLEYVGFENGKHTFKSLGVLDVRMENGPSVSTLFPIGDTVILEEGKFPLTDYKDLYEHSQTTHKISGKTVGIIGFDVSCHDGKLNKFGMCQITVKEIN